LDATRRSALARFGAERRLIVASLVALTLVAWAYLWLLAAGMARGDMSLMGMGAGEAMPMPDMPDMPGMGAAPWTAATFGLMFLMWWVMMVGMMVPSSMPTILLYARVQHHWLPEQHATRHVALFTAGYLLAWAAFSAVATSIQWALNVSGLIAPMTMSVSTKLGAALFAAAGVYQLSPFKNVCLRHCRSPAEFLAQHRRPGAAGAFLTGSHHGLYCVGCCWLLMALLFAGGVMNLLWVAALAVLVLLEKLVPHGHWLARASGVAMLAVAAYLLTVG
jgi:predicted metal-binding membrane protein